MSDFYSSRRPIYSGNLSAGLMTMDDVADRSYSSPGIMGGIRGSLNQRTDRQPNWFGKRFPRDDQRSEIGVDRMG